MNQITVNRILDVQELVRTDQPLMADYESRQLAFLEILPELTEKQKNILLDYLGVCVEVHLRMLELCCESNEQK